MMKLDFQKNERNLTLGVEMEIQLLDPNTLRLVPKAPEILEMLQHPRLTKEMFRSTLEIITGVCETVRDVHTDLSHTLKDVRRTIRQIDLVAASTGTHPSGDYNNRVLTSSKRYQELLDRNQWLIRRMAVYGLHVHIGMTDGDDAIRYNNFFLHFVPHMIALSASSPYWKGQDTGLAACRPTTYESHPTSGLPVVVEDWSGFQQLYQKLIQTGSIQSMKDIWWDMRPSPGYGTLEIRICDAPATQLELESIVAYIHLLAHWFRDHQSEFFERNTFVPRDWILRENKWRAIRYGLDAEIISHETLQTHLLSDHILYWLDKVQPYTTRLGYESYAECIRQILEYGNSSSRQRRVMQRSKDIRAVMQHNVREFEEGKPRWQDV